MIAEDKTDIKKRKEARVHVSMMFDYVENPRLQDTENAHPISI